MDDFEQRLREVRPVVERFVKFRVPASDAEDLIQEICLTAYLKYGQLKNQEAFKAWILRIARNMCTDYFRKLERNPEVAMEDIPWEMVAFGRMGRMTTAVEDTLEQLPEKDRQLLYLCYWQELSLSEIGKRMHIPLGTVKSRLHTARTRFKEQYPYPPKGVHDMTKLPKKMPEYTIERLHEDPFSCKWEETQGWLIIPKPGQKLFWAMYDFPQRTRTSWCKMEVVGKAEIHGIEGVEVTAVQYGDGDDRDPGFEDSMERRFVAQLTDTHCRFLAESHWENGVRKCYTFLDGDPFLNNWGFGEDNCGNEVDLRPKGLLKREGSAITAPKEREILDVVGQYAVTINAKRYDTVCVMDVELYNEAVVSEQYIDRNGRTVLWRRFNRDDWATDRFGGKRWSEKLPDNERITINGETYVHWYDCISDYIF